MSDSKILSVDEEGIKNHITKINSSLIPVCY